MSDSESQEQQIRQGDTTALAEYLDSHRDRLRIYIDRNMSGALRQKVDAEDLIQEVMVSCVGSLKEVDLGDREIFSWVCQVAQRRIIDAGRKYVSSQKRSAKREVSLHGGAPGDEDRQGLIHLLVASVTSPSRAFSRNQREFHLLAALDKLPAESRDVLNMRYVESLPSKEIAERMGKSDGAIRVMLTRSLKKLGELMGEEGGEGKG